MPKIRHTFLFLNITMLFSIKKCDPANNFLLWCLVSLSSLCPSASHGGNEEAPKLIIVSFDGFRWDFLSRPETGPANTPNFHRVMKLGVHAKYGLKNAFLTKTLPNHFTLVTGLYEESHGIVGNEMFDPVLNETFDLAKNDSQNYDPRWWDVGAEPIWVTNHLQRIDGRSGCVQWVGCGAPIKGVRPARYVPYTPTMPNKTRIDKLIDWFTHPKYPVNLGLLYFQEPDHTAHHFGPESKQVTDMIIGLDDVVGHLLKRMEEEDMLEDTNLIITSDHGFATTPKNLVINLDDYIDPGSYRIFQTSPVATLLPNKGMEEDVYSALSKGAEKAKTFQVYRKSTVPEEYHYQHNRRISPIIVEANEHYQIISNHSHYLLAGTHGYNNSLPDMHPIFMAMGPGFKDGAEVPSFHSVDVYPLMCRLLHLHPAPNNGSLKAVLPLLDTDHDDKFTVLTFGTYIFVLIVIGTVGGIFAVAACRQHRYLKRQQRGRIVALEGGIRYSTPPVNGGTKVPLLSEDSEEESFH